MCFWGHNSHQRVLTLEVKTNRIREVRKKLGWTQLQLADVVGTNQQLIQRIESGKTPPKMDTAYSICAALNVSFEEVFPDFGSLKSPIHDGLISETPAERDLFTGRFPPPDTGPDERRWNLGFTMLPGVKATYIVSTNTVARFESTALVDHSLENDMDPWFFVFDSLNRRVCINLDLIESLEVLLATGEPDSKATGSGSDKTIAVLQRTRPRFDQYPARKQATPTLTRLVERLEYRQALEAANPAFPCVFLNQPNGRVYLLASNIAILEVPRSCLSDGGVDVDTLGVPGDRYLKQKNRNLERMLATHRSRLSTMKRAEREFS